MSIGACTGRPLVIGTPSASPSGTRYPSVGKLHAAQLAPADALDPSDQRIGSRTPIHHALWKVVAQVLERDGRVGQLGTLKLRRGLTGGIGAIHQASAALEDAHLLVLDQRV